MSAHSRRAGNSGRSGDYPMFSPSQQVTRYLHVLETNPDGTPKIGLGGFWDVTQVEFNPPNYPLFQLGTVPFFGDYVEIASLPFLPGPNGTWTYNSNSAKASVFHTTWTDNRDVSYPNGNWWIFPWPTSVYNAPNSDSNTVPCSNSDLTGVRNQNVYTSTITEGIIVGSPGNSKQLDLERTFVVFVENTTNETKSFRLTIDAPFGVSASFKQFEDLDELDVTIGPYSTISRTVYVSSSNLRASVRVDVVEIDDPGGDPLGSAGLEGYVVLNPDPTNPDALEPDHDPLYYEVHNPRVENPRVENYVVLDELNTNLLNPRVENVDLVNSGYISPRVENWVLNPRVENPRVENLNILNLELSNPRVENPRVENAALVDVVWTVGNDGNTPSAYTFTLLSENADQNGDFDVSLVEQILIYKVHTTPAASAENGCILAEVHHDELVTVISNPRVENPRVENPRVENPRVENPRVENATINLAPGEEALFVLRIYDEDITVGPTIEDVIGTEEDLEIGAAATAHAVDTEDALAGETTPNVAYSEDYTPAIGHTPISMAFTASEGGANPVSQIFQMQNTAYGMLSYAISDDADWLDTSPADDIVYSGDPANSHTVSVDISGLTEGTYNADITIIGYGATNTPQIVPVTLTITASAPTPGEWVVRHTGVGTSDDFARDIVADAFGNIYVGGAVDGNLSGGQDAYDFITIKYNSTGNKLWEARYNGPHNSVDDIMAMAIDSAGNVYVTGGVDGSSNESYNIATIKYNSAGAQLWDTIFVGTGNSYDRPYDIAVDSSGNVCVVGQSLGVSGTQDFLTLKYDSNGTELWRAWYNGSGNGTDEPKAITIDAAGNIYITGKAVTSGTGIDYATIKYSSGGTELWANTYDSEGNADFPADITVDSSGNVYVTGTSDVNLAPSGDEYAFCTVKYDSSGTEVWAQRFNFGTSGGNDISLDSSGNVYVTGYSYLISSNTEDIFTIKYNSIGDVQWYRAYDGPGSGDDHGTDIVLDSSGNIYVTGYSTGNDSVYDYTTIKYDIAGNEEWVRRYDGPSSSEDEISDMTDRPSSITLDALGHICITGKSLGNGTGLDITTIRYRPTLEEWVTRYDGPASGVDYATYIAVDSSDNVYVTGESTGSNGDRDYATFKYDSSGNQQWVARYDGPANGHEHAEFLAVDSSENVYITGSSAGIGTSTDLTTIKYNSSGSLQWVARYNGPGNSGDVGQSLAVDSSGNVYVAGYSVGSSTNTDYVTIKYNSSGNQVWVARYDGPVSGGDNAWSLALDSFGNVYVTGYSLGIGNQYDYATIKYDTDGNELWVMRYDGPVNMFDRAWSLALDSSGNVYVTGISRGIGAQPDYATVKYDTDGNELWVRRYDGPGNSDDQAYAVVVDSSGNVYVTGESKGSDALFDYATIKYDTNGTQQWVTRYNGPGRAEDRGRSLSLDPSGNVYVTGWSVGSLGGTAHNYATIKYDSNGNEVWVMRYDGPGIDEDWAYSIALDSIGNVYVTGRSSGSGTDDDYATIKYKKEF